MKLRAILFLLLILAFIGTQVGCGKKAPPVPPPKPPEKSVPQGGFAN